MAIAAPLAKEREATTTSKVDSMPRTSRVVTRMEARERGERENGTSARAAAALAEEDG
jgi:hypothetical protein